MEKALKAVCIAVSVALAAGCTTMNQTTGKEETSTGKSVGVGAAAGAVIGGLLAGGNNRVKGAAIGAALGGGIGYLAALENRKKELAEAQAAAVEFKETTGIAPEVKKVSYQANGEKVEGLKSVDVPIPAAAVAAKGDGLTEKGKDTFTKLQAMSKKTGTDLVVMVPRSARQGVVADITEAAPSAKVVVGEGKGVVATLKAKPVTESGMTVV